MGFGNENRLPALHLSSKVQTDHQRVLINSRELSVFRRGNNRAVFCINIPRMSHKTVQRLLLIGLVLFTGWMLYNFWGLPSISSLPANMMTPSVRITDRNGHLLY